MKHQYNAKAIYELILSPKDFVKLSDEDRSNIKNIQIIPPKLGCGHFGKIKITRKNPVYAVAE